MQCYLQQFVQPIIEKKVDLKPLFSEECSSILQFKFHFTNKLSIEGTI